MIRLKLLALVALSGSILSGCATQNTNIAKQEYDQFHDFCLSQPIPEQSGGLITQKTQTEDSGGLYEKSLSASGEYTCTFKDNTSYQPVADVAFKYIGQFGKDYQVNYRAAFDENRNFIYHINNADRFYYDVNVKYESKSALFSLQLIGVTAGQVPATVIKERREKLFERFVW